MDANMNEDNQDTNSSRMMKFDPAVLVVSHIRTMSKFLPLILSTRKNQ